MGIKPASKYSEIGMVNNGGSKSGHSSGAESVSAHVGDSKSGEPGMIGTWQKFENQYIKPTFTKEKKDPYSYEAEQPLDAAAQNAHL
jgi:hypothetical protein